MNHSLRPIMLILVLSVFAAIANGATFVVNTTDDTADATPGDGICADAAAQCSLRAAISEANAFAGDDIITVPAGTYTQALVAANEDLNAGGDWDIRSNITINGAGAETTIFQAAPTPGTATERVMESPLSTSVVTITGVTLRHGFKTGTAGNTTRGGGIRNAGTMTINDSIVTLNTSPGSGGVRNERVITLNNVVVSNNSCSNTGTTCFGGGMYNTLAANSTVTINNCTFTGNTSAATGLNGFGFAAGLGIESSTGFTLVVSGSTFSNNTGTGNGTGGSNGNGIRALATNVSTLNVTNSTFSGNGFTGGSSVSGSGLQIFTSGTNGRITATLDGVTVSGNNAVTGAGIAVNATGNVADLTIRNSTISGNTASGNGAGIAMTNATSTTGAANVVSLLNSTVSGNIASGGGAGINIESPAATGSVTANLNFVTVANNRANNDDSGTDVGGGIRQVSGTVNFKNSIVADNSVGTGGSAPDISGTVVSGDYNHIEDLTGATIGGSTSNNATGDPQLGPLASNGGTTQTHLPANGSPVRNTIPFGTNDCGTGVTTDQRALARPSENACEKGSVEIQFVLVPVTVSGTIRSASGRPLSNIIVTLTGGSNPGPIAMAVQTGHFGTFQFTNVPAGNTYTLSVANGRRFTFSPASRDIIVNGNLENQDFFATTDLLKEQ